MLAFTAVVLLAAVQALSGSDEAEARRAFAEEMALIPAGAFHMGSPPDEPGRLHDEALHRVALTRPFYLGRTQVSWSLWNEVRDWALANGYTDLAEGNNGYWAMGGEDHPVTNVSWWDAIQWCNARSEMEGRVPVYYSREDFAAESVVRRGMPAVHVRWDADGYRLPTEAEWEYACRAGTRSAFHTGPITAADSECVADPNLDRAGWHCGNSDTNTHPAGEKAPNDWGLHDMHGNVWEWCGDWYGPYPQRERVRDPRGPAAGTARVLRGGSWMNHPRQARSAYRHALAPATVFYTIGFRVAVSAGD